MGENVIIFFSLDNNQTVKEFLNSKKIDTTVQNLIVFSRAGIIDDINKPLKDYGYENNQGGMVFGGKESGGLLALAKGFQDNIILSDLIKGKNGNCFDIYVSPEENEKRNYGDSIWLEITGSKDGPVFGGKNGKFSLNSNIAKAAVFMGKCQVGQRIRIEIKIMKNDSVFEGSTNNEIKTSDFRFIDDCFILDKFFYEDSPVYYII